jgi:hypothetical protein
MNLSGVITLFVAVLLGLVLLAVRGRGRWFGVALLFLALACGGWLWSRDSRYSGRYDSIPLGTSREQVIGILGTPTTITDCTTGYGGYKRGDIEMRDMPKNCKEEFWYYSFYGPESWTYAFDSQQTLINKYHLSSP